jgi:hypothetical protein
MMGEEERRRWAEAASILLRTYNRADDLGMRRILLRVVIHHLDRIQRPIEDWKSMDVKQRKMMGYVNQK